jgi:hypothetical protein
MTVKISPTISVVLCVADLPAQWTDYSSLRNHFRLMGGGADQQQCVETMFKSIGHLTLSTRQTLIQPILKSVGAVIQQHVFPVVATAGDAGVVRKKYVTLSWQQVICDVAHDLIPFLAKDKRYKHLTDMWKILGILLFLFVWCTYDVFICSHRRN